MSSREISAKWVSVEGREHALNRDAAMCSVNARMFLLVTSTRVESCSDLFSQRQRITGVGTSETAPGNSERDFPNTQERIPDDVCITAGTGFA